MYSRQLNFHPGIYGSGYGMAPSYSHHNPNHMMMISGSRNGQGFVGNPGIGIRQSGETLANVYPQMSYGASTTSSLFGSPYGSLTPPSSTLMMMPATYSSPMSLYGGHRSSSYGSSYLSSPYYG
ncbi:hypothetical protein BLA29_011757 [Euroglyphus maynei]|uniref:Uncharacterized protein n=1 Tax=Euroglyphus maynei TaxID=6958 RepID=A0A1Y3AWU6_EURMA|nr:hypothetical protein BLA29_011757 [Euroglyphus maynei]